MSRLAETFAREICRTATPEQPAWILDADLGDSYGLQNCAYDGQRVRFIQVGIAEQTLVSVAAGLAACQQRVFVFSFAAFLCCRAYDQIRVCISQTHLPVVLVGSHAGGCNSTNGKTHSIFNDVALMSTLPNIDVWAPADGLDVEWMLRQIWREQRPAYIRLPRDPQRALGGAAAEFRWFGPPSQVITVSSGLGTQWALEVKQLLVAVGLNMTVLHLPKIWPLPDAVCEALEGAKYLFVIEDHSECGGLADLLRRSCPGKIIYCHAWPGNWPGASGAVADLRRHCGMDAESIMRRYLEVMDLARNESAMQTEVPR